MEKYDDQLEAETILDLDSIATKATEMGVSDFWGNLLILIAAEKGYDNGPQKVVFKRHTGSLLVAIGDFTKTDDFDVKTFKVLDREMSYTTFNDGVVFDIPIESEVQDNSERTQAAILNSKKETTQPQKETSVTEENKEQGEATKHGPALTVEEITGILIDLGVSENDVKESFFHLPTKLAIGKLPNVTIHRVDDKITLTYGNTEKATLLDKAAAQDARLPDSMRLSPEEIRYEAFDDVVNQSGLYIYTVPPKKETEMAYLPKTTIQILKPIYRDRLQKAGLSDEAVQFISDEIFHGSALKAPKEDSSFVITAGKDVLNVYYSHDNKSIALTDIETTKTTSSGEVVSYSTGARCAFFVVDISNKQEKLIQRHVGEPTLTLNLGNGRSVNIPFKKEYLGFDKDYVITQITADFSMVTTNGGLNNLDGPALVDETGTAPYRFFANSQEYTAEELTKKVEQWIAEGIVKPKLPSR